MIGDNKNHQALEALHRVLCHARTMALSEEPQSQIAQFLDWAELLPVHLAHEEDRTVKFERVLAALAEADHRTKWIFDAYLKPASEPRSGRNRPAIAGSVH
jgi:hypothetical protein